MKKQDLHIGQKLFFLDPTTRDLEILEAEITQLKQRNDGLIEVYFESSQYNGSSMYFNNGVLESDYFFFTPEEAKEKYKIRLIAKINGLERQIKELRLKNWELLCK